MFNFLNSTVPTSFPPRRGPRRLFPAPHRLRSAVLFLSLSLLLAPSRADKMLILDDPVQAAQVRVDLIQQAKHSIYAQYFIVGDDPLTFEGLALVRDAARRGVNVRIIVDAEFDRVPKLVAAYLITQGVQIKVYHPFSLTNLRWITRRMHDKVISIDDRQMILGGRNVANAYFGRAPTNFIDRDAYIEGQVVRHARAYFDALWNSKEVAWLHPGKLDARQLEAGRKILDDARRNLAMSTQWKLDTHHHWDRGLAEAGPIHFFHDPIGEKDLEPGVAEKLRALVAQAHHSLLIESPYLVPTPELFRDLRLARTHGVSKIQIITNSAGSNDDLWAQAGYEAAKSRLLAAGVDLWEFKGPDCLHAKSAAIDGQYAVIASFNLDPRSQHLNTETAAAAEDSYQAAHLALAINAHKQAAWHIGPAGRPLADAADYPRAPLTTRIMVALLRLTLPLVWSEL